MEHARIPSLPPAAAPRALPPGEVIVQEPLSRGRPPRALLDILVHRRWLVLGFVVAVLGTVALWSFTTPPTYEATAVIQIDPDRPRVVAFGDAPQEEFYNERVFDAYYGTQFERLMSRSLLARVETGLGLEQHPAFSTANGRGRLLAVRLAGLWPGLEWAAADPEDEAESAFQGLEAYVSVEPVKRSRLVLITARMPDAELAATVANRVATEYIAMTEAERREASEAASRWLEGQLTGLRQRSEEASGAIQRFVESHKLVPAEDGRLALVVQQLEERNRAYTDAESDRVQKEARFRMIASADPQTAASLIGSDVLRDLKTDLARLEREVSRARTVYGPQHPKMVELEADLANAQARLDQEIGKGRVAAEREYMAAVRRASELARRLDTQRDVAIRQHARQMQLHLLRKEAEASESVYGDLMKRLKELQLAAQMRITNVRVIDPAETPDGPISPKNGRDLVLALVGGLMGGIGLAFVRELGDRTLRTAREADLMIQLPSVGTVPAIRSYSRRALPAVDDLPVRALPGETLRWREQVAGEAFRSIRAMVLRRAPAAPRTILVTSAQPSEGKSFVAINLAVTLAEMGRPVLIVDADLRRPICHRAFGLELPSTGLSTLLYRGLPPESVVVQSGVPSLWFLPAGPRPPDPAALLSSERAGEVLDRAAQRYHWIVIDSPPVLAASDATVLAGIVDGVLLVARAHATPVDAIQLARERLEAMGANILGVVLNDVRLARNRYFYANYG
jgi:capsular exopolysaccharide synthesis family protein